MAKLRFKIRWLILGVLALFYLPLVPGCIMAHAPKSGRIVDETTGKGIPNAFVIVAAEMTNSGGTPWESHTATDTEYRVVVHTDSDGNYWIPNTWLHLDFAHFYPFFGSHRERWVLTAFKPGYVIADDERNWDEIPPNAPYYLQSARFNASAHPPAAYWLGLFVKVEPLLMHETTLSIGDSARYYGSVIGTGQFGIKREWTTDELSMRDASTLFFLPRICALDPEQEIDWGHNIGAFVIDPKKYRNRWHELDPSGFERASQTGKDRSKAKYVCEAMKDTVEKQ